MGVKIDNCIKLVIKDKNTGKIIQEIDFNSTSEQTQKNK